MKETYQYGEKYSVKNSIQLIEKLKKVVVTENMNLISLDVKDMFTSIKVEKAINLLESNNFGGYENKDQVLKVIKECLKENYFRFNNYFYVQREGLPMGSLLSPTIAEIVMNDLENMLLDTTKYKEKIQLWSRYVHDDVLVIWEANIEEVYDFVKEVSSMDSNIQFKEEIGRRELNYLDLMIKIMGGKEFMLDIFRKGVYSDLIIPNDSYHPYKYKMAALNAFCFRMNTCLKDDVTKDNELKRIKQIAKHIYYYMNVVNKIIDKICIGENVGERKDRNYMGSITYIGTKTKSIIECFKKYAIGVAIKRCMTVFDKIKNSNTEEIPILQKIGVYKLKCKDCSKLYIGKTGRKFECRLADHKSCLLYTSRCV